MRKAPFPVNHDLHTHTSLSACCSDAELTGAYTCDFAARQGYDMLCITNHLWDAAVPGASDWYAPQDVAHVKELLPLPRKPGMRILFGCETEFCGGKKLGISAAHYDDFDMIVVPLNHFHMEGFVRPRDCDSVQKVSDLLMTRLEELLELDLPWRKVGLAHLNDCIYMRGERYAKALELLSESRLRAAFARVAQKGAGIELNASGFGPDWMDNPSGGLRLLKIALEEGCKFYCASDAHARESLSLVGQRLRGAADAIGLTAQDLFVPQG